MSKISVVRRCYGCGAVLQSDNKRGDGYIEPKTLDETPLDKPIFCDRCYRDSKYNLEPSQASVSPDFLTMLLDAKASDAFIVYLIDLYSFECSFVKDVVEAIQRLKILVLANKRDLLPSKAKDSDLKEYVAHRFRASGLAITAEDVVLVSLTSATDMTKIVKEISERRRRHDVYIIGAASSGKSLFLTSVLRQYKNESPRSITTSEYPGTALSIIQIPLDASSSVYDTPGTGVQNSFIGLSDETLVKTVTPTGPVEGRDFALAKDGSLFIGGLARLDFLGGKADKTSITAYFPPSVELRKVAPEKDLDSVFAEAIAPKAKGFKHLMSASKISPTTPLVSGIKDMDAFDLRIAERGQRDVGIAGLGWVSFKGAGQTFRIYVPKGIGVYGSRAKVK
jgi:ribosome biogenesis GTPase A